MTGDFRTAAEELAQTVNTPARMIGRYYCG